MTKLFIKKTRLFLCRSFMACYSVFHSIERKVVFESFTGKQYSDNPRVISERLHQMFPDCMIVWAFDSSASIPADLPDYIKPVNKKTLLYYRELATAFCYVTNEAIEPNIRKRKGQFFIQTWHGDRGFKRVLYDAWIDGKRPIPVIDGEVVDLCIAASDYGIERYHSAFHYYGEILKTGMPRNDRLVCADEDEIRDIRSGFGVHDGEKVLLFAPTVRRAHHKQNVEVDLDSIIRVLEQKTGDRWLCMIRAHSASGGFTGDMKNALDVTQYPDMTDLMLAADMLITDYSSCAGDFILRRKPVILAAFDMEEYKKNIRALKVQLEEPGYFIARNQKELEDIIRQKTADDYVENCETVMRFYGTSESGRSCEAVCNRIIKAYEKNSPG